jgi:hypothetical protein
VVGVQAQRTLGPCLAQAKLNVCREEEEYFFDDDDDDDDDDDVDDVVVDDVADLDDDE